MTVAFSKGHVVRYLVIALIIGFFIIPVITFSFFDCQFFVPKRLASALLFFFR